METHNASYIAARTVIARDQFVCRGTMQINESLVVGTGATATIGQQKYRFTDDSITLVQDGRERAIISKNGVCVSGGFSLQETPDVVIERIVRAIPESTCDDARSLPTTSAVREYVDAHAIGATFDAIKTDTLSARNDEIIIDGPTRFGRDVTIAGAIKCTIADIVADSPITSASINAPIVRVSPRAPGNVVDIRAEIGTCAQFVLNPSAESPGVMLRFDCGCLWLARPMRIMKFSDTHWACFESNDAFFPTRIGNIAPDLRATSCAINATGDIAAFGNANDAGGRGCVHVYKRAGAVWNRACQKIVNASILSGASQTSDVPIRRQGLCVALDGRGIILAIASERDIWLNDIGSDAVRKQKSQFLGHFTIPSTCADISQIRMSADGSTLIVGTANSVIIHDIRQGAADLVARELCAPCAISHNGDTVFAYAPAQDSGAPRIARVSYDKTAHSYNIANYEACAQTGILGCAPDGASFYERNTSAYASTCAEYTTNTRIMRVQHESVERARIEMDANIREIAMSADGAVALVLLSDGTARFVY